MRKIGLSLLATAALSASAWAGGDSGYTPPGGAPLTGATTTTTGATQPDYMDSCRKTIRMAEDGLGRASPTNAPRAEAWIAKANASMTAGDGWTCLNQAHEAMTFEH